MRKWTGFLTLAGVVLAASTLVYGQNKEQKAAAELIGKYKIVAGQMGSKKIPADDLTDNEVTITDRTIVVYDKDRKQLYAATYQLDTQKMPWALHMNSTMAPKRDVKSEGLIGKDGPTIKLIYSLPGGKTPDDFEPEEKQQLFVLQRRE